MLVLVLREVLEPLRMRRRVLHHVPDGVAVPLGLRHALPLDADLCGSERLGGDVRRWRGRWLARLGHVDRLRGRRVEVAVVVVDDAHADVCGLPGGQVGESLGVGHHMSLEWDLEMSCT